MTNKYYVIKYQFGTWTRTHVSGFTLTEAQNFGKNIENSDIIHEMWLDCLDEWPKPGFFKQDGVVNENLWNYQR